MTESQTQTGRARGPYKKRMTVGTERAIAALYHFHADWSLTETANRFGLTRRRVVRLVAQHPRDCPEVLAMAVAWDLLPGPQNYLRKALALDLGRG